MNRSVAGQSLLRALVHWLVARRVTVMMGLESTTFLGVCANRNGARVNVKRDQRLRQLSVIQVPCRMSYEPKFYYEHSILQSDNKTRTIQGDWKLIYQDFEKWIDKGWSTHESFLNICNSELLERSICPSTRKPPTMIGGY